MAGSDDLDYLNRHSAEVDNTQLTSGREGLSDGRLDTNAYEFEPSAFESLRRGASTAIEWSLEQTAVDNLMLDSLEMTEEEQNDLVTPEIAKQEYNIDTEEDEPRVRVIMMSNMKKDTEEEQKGGYVGLQANNFDEFVNASAYWIGVLGTTMFTPSVIAEDFLASKAIGAIGAGIGAIGAGLPGSAIGATVGTIGSMLFRTGSRMSTHMKRMSKLYANRKIMFAKQNAERIAKLTSKQIRNRRAGQRMLSLTSANVFDEYLVHKGKKDIGQDYDPTLPFGFGILAGIGFGGLSAFGKVKRYKTHSDPSVNNARERSTNRDASTGKAEPKSEPKTKGDPIKVDTKEVVNYQGGYIKNKKGKTVIVKDVNGYTVNDEIATEVSYIVGKTRPKVEFDKVMEAKKAYDNVVLLKDLDVGDTRFTRFNQHMFLGNVSKKDLDYKAYKTSEKVLGDKEFIGAGHRGSRAKKGERLAPYSHFTDEVVVNKMSESIEGKAVIKDLKKAGKTASEVDDELLTLGRNFYKGKEQVFRTSLMQLQTIHGENAVSGVLARISKSVKSTGLPLDPHRLFPQLETPRDLKIAVDKFTTDKYGKTFRNLEGLKKEDIPEFFRLSESRFNDYAKKYEGSLDYKINKHEFEIDAFNKLNEAGVPASDIARALMKNGKHLMGVKEKAFSDAVDDLGKIFGDQNVHNILVKTSAGVQMSGLRLNMGELFPMLKNKKALKSHVDAFTSNKQQRVYPGLEGLKKKDIDEFFTLPSKALDDYVLKHTIKDTDVKKSRVPDESPIFKAEDRINDASTSNNVAFRETSKTVNEFSAEIDKLFKCLKGIAE